MSTKTTTTTTKTTKMKTTTTVRMRISFYSCPSFLQPPFYCFHFFWRSFSKKIKPGLSFSQYCLFCFHSHFSWKTSKIQNKKVSGNEPNFFWKCFMVKTKLIFRVETNLVSPSRSLFSFAPCRGPLHHRLLPLHKCHSFWPKEVSKISLILTQKKVTEIATYQL